MAWTAVQRLPLVVALAQPVALPVGHPPALALSKYQVDRAGEKAPAFHFQLGKLLGVGAAKPPFGMVGKGACQVWGAHQAEGQIEVHLIEAGTALKLGQAEVVAGAAQGRVPQLLQPN